MCNQKNRFRNVARAYIMYMSVCVFAERRMGKSESAYSRLIKMSMNLQNFLLFVSHTVNRIDIDPSILLDYNNDINKWFFERQQKKCN